MQSWNYCGILDVDLDVDVVDVNVDVAQCNGWRVTSRREQDSIAVVAVIDFAVVTVVDVFVVVVVDVGWHVATMMYQDSSAW